MSIEFFQKVSAAWKQAKEAWRNNPIKDTSLQPDWQDESAPAEAPRSEFRPGPEANAFDPEEYTKQALAIDDANPPKGPQWLMDQIRDGKAVVDRGYVYQARQDKKGRILKESMLPRNSRVRQTYKIKPVRGHEEFMAEVAKAEASQRLRENAFGTNPSLFGPFDPNQYTEYAPLMGGYFFAQQYLTDQLKGFAYAFEAWNHNPLAHRIVNALAQYTMGRRFTWHIKDEKKEQVWNEFAEKHNLVQMLSKYWLREKLIFGEMFIDKSKWRSIHPATVWEIITDPDNFSDVFYYYRSYPTAYQMFTGAKVAGAPGSDKVQAQRYVVEQLPFSQIIHTKAQCTSFEKRGRSTLFPILGWLKRIKDIYNNQAIREQMLADYVWDVEIKGGPSDVARFASQYTPLAQAGSTHFHNETVKRTPMAVSAGVGRGQSEASNNILAFIATAIGLPKDFFNVIAQSGGNRATALVAAEPFTKVVEDEQADQEYLLHCIAEHVFEEAGMTYEHGDIEFTFPSVTKDTTTETVKNIIIGETQGYISKERAATLFTQEMNITAYNFDDEMNDIKDEVNAGNSNLMQPGMPDGRMGGTVKSTQDITPIEDPNQPAGAQDDGSVHDGDNPNHGQPKVNLKKQMGKL